MIGGRTVKDPLHRKVRAAGLVAGIALAAWLLLPLPSYRAVAPAPGAEGALPAGSPTLATAGAPGEVRGPEGRRTAPRPEGGATPPPAAARGRGPVTVRVVSLHGRALPHARIRVAGVGDGAVVHRTAGDGTIGLADAPYDGSATLCAVDLRPDPHAREPDAVIRGRDCTLRVPTGWPLRVRPVDAHTGEVVETARWRLHLDDDPDQPLLDADGGEATVFARPGGSCVAVIEVMAPPGYVAWDLPIFEHPVARDAHGLLICYPLRREMAVSARLEGESGAALAAARMCRVALGGIEGPLQPLESFQGHVRARGIPFFPETDFGVALTERPRLQPGGPRAHLLGEVSGSVPLQHHKEAAGEVRTVLHRGGLAPGGTLQTRVQGLMRVWRQRERAAEQRIKGPGAGRVLAQVQARTWGWLRVLRRDGRPAPGARVWMDGEFWRVDGEGRLALVLRGERLRCYIDEPGLTFSLLDVALERPRRQEVVLQEDPAGGLAIEVTDGQGRPLPFAGVEVRMGRRRRAPIRWTPQDPLVQRLDAFSDHLGRFTAEAVDPGRATIRASWGDRTGESRINVAADEVHDVRLALKAVVRKSPFKPAPRAR